MKGQTQKLKMRSAYSPAKRVRTGVGTKSVTKQSFKNECDINEIVAKYQETGALSHFNVHNGRYDYATSLDFREAMEVVRAGQKMFEDLPSTIRTRFNNRPGEFLDFVQDPKNAEEMVEMGLCEAPEDYIPPPDTIPVGMIVEDPVKGSTEPPGEPSGDE